MSFLKCLFVIKVVQLEFSTGFDEGLIRELLPSTSTLMFSNSYMYLIKTVFLVD